jgi:large subunit ribosomal protein L15
MSLSLDKISRGKNTTKKRKRIGRGNASGTGTYSGKGLKGQNSRSGVSGLKRLGMKQVLLRTPKVRGFKSGREKAQVVNLIDINKNFKDGESINPSSLFTKNLVDKKEKTIKILGSGKLTVKNLKFSNVKMSESVRGQIENKK